jgi:DNA-directed RNA polymerase subunit H (RpoH/RPB5)
MKDFDLKEEIIKTIHHKDPFLPIIVTATSCSKNYTLAIGKIIKLTNSSTKKSPI